MRQRPINASALSGAERESKEEDWGLSPKSLLFYLYYYYFFHTMCYYTSISGRIWQSRRPLCSFFLPITRCSITQSLLADCHEHSALVHHHVETKYYADQYLLHLVSRLNYHEWNQHSSRTTYGFSGAQKCILCWLTPIRPLYIRRYNTPVYRCVDCNLFVRS